MEQRLFLIACVMYVFTLITRYLNKKEALKTPWRFAIWHSAFLVCILVCAWYVISFILSNGMGGEAIPAGKQALVYLFILAAAFYGLKSGYEAKKEKKDKIQKADLDWANTVYFAGFVASFVMFFFIQAFKIPSASMRDTLLEGDHLFVNKAVYGFRIPLTDIRFGQYKPIERGDIVIFSFPAKHKYQINCGGYQYGKDYVKRVIGLPGDKVEILGILGNGFPVEAARPGMRAVLMGGGIGVPPILQLAKELDCDKTVVVGYRDSQCFLREDFEKYAKTVIATEDGSVGTKGNVMDALKASGIEPDILYACGPMPMLKAIRSYALEKGILAYISLEERMACGVGACLGCVCKTTAVDHHSHVHNARICTDGPVFEAREVEI